MALRPIPRHLRRTLRVAAADGSDPFRRAVARFVAGHPGRALLIRPLAGDGVEAAYRADEPTPGASLLKVPLVMAVYDAATRGELDLAQRVPLAALPGTRHPTVLAALAGEGELTLRSVCGLAIVTSDNPCADHLLERVGRDAVHRCLQELGCGCSRLEVGFGDGELREAGRHNVTTARDALRFVSIAATDPRYGDVGSYLRNNQRNHRINLMLPIGTPVAHKSGTLPGVANDAGVVFGEGVTLGVAVLTDGEGDLAAASREIGSLVRQAWLAHGQRVPP